MADNQKVLMPKFAYRRRENMYNAYIATTAM